MFYSIFRRVTLGDKMRNEIQPGKKAEILEFVKDTVDQALSEIPATGNENESVPTPPIDVGDVLEDDELVETVDFYYDLLDPVVQGSGGCYKHLTPEQATEIGLTPQDLQNVNCAVDIINTTAGAVSATGISASIPRHDAVLTMASSITATPMMVGIALRGLLALWKLLKLIWKLLKWLLNGKKHIQKIRQTQRLRDAGRISAEAARKVIAARLAALSALIASTVTEIAEAKKLIEELRKAGKNKEADDLEERVKKIQEKLDQLKKQYEDLEKEEKGK